MYHLLGGEREFFPEREFFIGNLLVQIHCIIVMITWTGLASWEFSGSAALLDVAAPCMIRYQGSEFHFFGFLSSH